MADWKSVKLAKKRFQGHSACHVHCVGEGTGARDEAGRRKLGARDSGLVSGGMDCNFQVRDQRGFVERKVAE